MEKERVHLDFPCRRCKQTFKTKREHLIHRKEIHENDPERKKHVCSLCLKLFANERTLEQHMRNHNLRCKRFICTECGKEFAKSEYLSRHSLIHSGEKPHECSICGKRFNQFGNMKRHELTHTGEKPFRCKRCGKMFSQRGNLKTHIMRHQNFKPFLCQICNKRFLQMGIYNKHMTRHHNISPEQNKNVTLVSDPSDQDQNDAQKGELVKREMIDPHLYYECELCKTIFGSFLEFQNHELFCELSGEVQVETESEVANSIDY